jgi:uncharacterized SAM-binding protein YcdF (DUF218 family)
MFIIGKLFSWFFLPPGIFITLLVISLILLKHDKKKLTFIFMIVNLILLYALSITPVKNLLLRPLEYSFAFPDIGRLQCDAIVILGGGTTGKKPDRLGKNSLSAQSFIRTYAGFAVWKKTGKPVIVTGGQTFGAIQPEGDTMAEYLTEMGIPENLITRESKSRDTIENARFTKKILMKKNYSTVALVTSAYHMKRSVMIFRKFNISVVPVPVDYHYDSGNFSIDGLMPQIGNLGDSFTAIHEYIGILSTKIRLKKTN